MEYDKVKHRVDLKDKISVLLGFGITCLSTTEMITQN